MNRKILNLALPNILSNITVPLLGLVDLAIVGHLDSEAYIGAVAISISIFNFVYWNFGFLRMGTSGFTSQALGSRNLVEVVSILFRALFVAFLISLFLLLSQNFILPFAFSFLNSDNNLHEIASIYFDIYIWAAPAILCLYVLQGWFVGMQNTRILMILVISINFLNILLSILFVPILNFGISGVALASLISQYFGLILGFFILIYKYGRLLKYFSIEKICNRKQFISFFKVNSNIFLRTLCLVSVFTFFTLAGANYGDTILAMNTILLQLFTVFSYVMDGFAYAGEALVGKYKGANNTILLSRSIKYLFKWGFILTLFFLTFYLFAGKNFLRVLTDKEYVIICSYDYFYWILFVPLVSFAGFLWDGIYIGATASKEMRNSMFIATFLFFTLYFSLNSLMGNNALWLAFIVFLASRGILQTIFAPQELKLKLFTS